MAARKLRTFQNKESMASVKAMDLPQNFREGQVPAELAGLVDALLRFSVGFL